MKLISWREVKLWDSDGNLAEGDTLIAQLREFRNSSGTTGYWFCNVAEPNAPDGTAPPTDGMAWDPYNNGFRNDWEAGPERDDVDWTGFSER